MLAMIVTGCGPPPTPAPTATLTPTLPPLTATIRQPPPDFKWSRVSHEEISFGGAADQIVNAIAMNDSIIVAVGLDRSGDDNEAAVWTSPDGLRWLRTPPDESALGGLGDQIMNGVTAMVGGFVAVGEDRAGGDPDGAVWMSADGQAWLRVANEGGVFGGAGSQIIWSVVASGSVLIAAGQEITDSGSDGAVWASPDGKRWVRVKFDGSIFPADSDQALYSLTLGGPGLVAVGEDSATGNFDGAVWTSRDGLSWTRVTGEAFGGPTDQTLYAVTSGGPGLVAVGRDAASGESTAAVWVSADGEVWGRVPHDEGVFGGEGEQVMYTVKSLEGLVVTAGFDSGGGDFEAAVWTSSDGVNWTRVQGEAFQSEADQVIYGLAIGAQGAVAGGQDLAGGESDAAFWTGKP